MPASVHFKRVTRSAKSFRIRTYTKRGEGEGPRSTIRLNAKTKAGRLLYPPFGFGGSSYNPASPGRAFFPHLSTTDPEYSPSRSTSPNRLAPLSTRIPSPCSYALKSVRPIVASAVQSTHLHNSIYVALFRIDYGLSGTPPSVRDTSVTKGTFQKRF